MKRIIVTGANGVGKTHFASRLASVRPEVPLVSFDAIKLRTGWRQRPRSDIDALLNRELEKGAWILEGGPSLLPRSLGRADALVWLDPPDSVRTWQLLMRPWKHFGKTRPEMPSGNIDWPWQQYAFAIRSLKRSAEFRDGICDAFRAAEGLRKWRCRNEADLAIVIAHWAEAGS